MPLYQLHSQGPEVAQLQTRLKALGLYAGPVDPHYDEFQAMLGLDRDDQLLWARSIQDRAPFRLVEPWAGMFKTLGRAPEFQSVEMKYAQQVYQDATVLCGLYGVSSERAVALMFDIKVQNGSINTVVQAQIQRDVAGLDAVLQGDDLEVARLQIIANRRAEAANPQWVEDVRQRKLTIAHGTGVVHGRRYDLATQYGVRLTPAGT